MTDQDAILAAIFATPADDAPRLVYADWLDEHDHPVQAEFVRRQIELFCTPDDNSRRPARVAAVEECWNRFKVELVETLPATEVRLDLYARGLPEQAYDTSADRFLADAGNWWPVFPVRKLTLDGWVARVHDVCQCAYLDHVTDLALRFPAMDVHAARALVASPHLANVRRLRLLGFSVSRDASLLLRGHFKDRLHRIS